MKFDAIVGNPPYQEIDDGYGVSSTPVYQLFVKQAKELNAKYISMIMPARWYTSGKGLDTFRKEMLHDRSIRAIHDYPEASDCFSGVQIKGGLCCFLFERDNQGDCFITTHRGNKAGKTILRPLLEEGNDVFIRYNEAIGI